MNRSDLTHTPWERRHPLLPPQKPKTGRPSVDHRRLLDGIVWRLRTGAPWRDLPTRSGPWRTVASRFYRWQRAGMWSQLCAAVQTQAEAAGQLHGAIHDSEGTMIRAHRHVAGATTGTQRPQPSA